MNSLVDDSVVSLEALAVAFFSYDNDNDHSSTYYAALLTCESKNVCECGIYKTKWKHDDKIAPSQNSLWSSLGSSHHVDTEIIKMKNKFSLKSS